MQRHEKQKHSARVALILFIISINCTELNANDYDAIVVGGGAGGCVASQTMVENGKKVLLLERGGEPSPSTKNDVYTNLNKSKNKCIETFDGDGIVVATGNCLGGATTFNQGIWIEEQPDFLNSFGGLFETENVVSAFHYVTKFFGFNEASEQDQNAKVYIDEMIRALDNHPEFDIANISSLGQVQFPGQGIWRTHTTFQQITGVRKSADQILDRTNPRLEIRLGTEVTKVVFRNISNVPTATCVKIKTKKGNQNEDEEVCVKAEGRIYLAAGAFHTPILLMKSGIKTNGEIYNNDQVGNNLSEKPMCYVGQEFNDNFTYATKTVAEVVAYTKHKSSSGREMGLLFEEISVSSGKDNAQTSIFERIIAPVGKRFNIRTTLSVGLLQYCLNRLDRNLITCSSIKKRIMSLPPVFLLTTIVATPTSRGNVSLMPNGKIRISPGYLTTDDDVEALGFALRTAQNVTSSIAGPFTPVKFFGPSFVLNANNLSDRQLGEKAKSAVYSAQHFAGTAQIARVVDNQLKVIGVNGLYVADASALPSTPRVNAMASVMVIGRLAGIGFV